MKENSVGTDSSKIELEDALCPNDCPRDDEFVLVGRDRLHNLPGEFAVVRCRNCDLQRTNPRPTASAMSFYYPTNYAPYSQIDSKPELSPLKSWLLDKLGFKNRSLPETAPGRLLEIGCSSGDFLHLANAAGWKVEGVESSDYAAQKARDRGFLVRTGSIELTNFEDDSFDVITAWMVVEHLHDPVKALKKIKSWVKKDGYFVFLIPDTSSISRRIFQNLSYDLQLPTHLFHFNPSTIKSTLSTAGWTIERIKWQNNCNTLLWSCCYWAREKKKNNLLKIMNWLRQDKKAKLIRLSLSFLLGITKQSGRIEIWAQPLK